MENLWVVVAAALVALVVGGIIGYSLAYFRLRRLEERWRSFVARHKREVDIAQARANELAHQLEAVRAGTDSAELHSELERTQRSLADAEARAALLRPEVDALHHLLTEKEQEVLLLKESMRERKPAAGPLVEEAPRAAEPPAGEEQVTPAPDEALVAAPPPEPVPSTPDQELPAEFAVPPSDQEAATAEVAAGDATEPLEEEVAEPPAGDTTEPLEEELAEVAAGDATEPVEEEIAEIAAADATEPLEEEIAEVAEITAADASLNGEDDLTAITGIGPVTARRLRHNGVTTFAQLAGLTDEAIDELAPKLKSAATRIRRDRWVEQARELAADRID
jgi:predicted flap endonuclease-1-like 5' DNA nuclease